MRQIKNVQVYNHRVDTIEIFQSYYLDGKAKRLKRNVVVVTEPDMETYLQINNYGFKGEDLDPEKKLIAVWGDSVVFAIKDGWVEKSQKYLDNYQVLNGGIEGDSLSNIAERAAESNEELKIDYNVIFPGWHCFHNLEKSRELMEKMIDALPGPILMTLPTSLNSNVVQTGLEHSFVSSRPPDHSRDYYFWGNYSYSKEVAKELLEDVQRLNTLINDIAEEKKVPLIDLYSEFKSDKESDFREHFFDAGHPRPDSYPAFSKVLGESLQALTGGEL